MCTLRDSRSIRYIHIHIIHAMATRQLNGNATVLKNNKIVKKMLR